MPKVGALALVKAHPLVFCGFVAVAIGVVIYSIVKTKQRKNKKHAHSNSSNRPDDGGNDGPSDFYYYDASTKSVTNSAAPVESKASENSNLRRRSTAQNSSSTVPKDPEAADEKKSKLTVSKEVQTESVDCNQNDINKVLPSKDLNIAMSVDEKITDYLRNIPVLDSTDNNDETASEDSIIKPIRNCCCNCDSHSAEDSCSSSSASSVCSSWSNVSLTDVDNMKRRKKSRKSRASSVCSIETETSVGTVLSGDSELCKGCEEKPVNTHAQPCNHRYMCSDCAMRIFKLYKRCKVCRARIERIVVED